MRNASPVGVSERRQRLAGVIEGCRQWQRAGLQDAVERLPFDPLHDHDQIVVFPKGVVNGGNIGMAQAGLDLNFAVEAEGLFFQVGIIAQQNLHGLDSAGNGVFDLEDLADAARSQDALDLVGSYGVSDQQAHRSHRLSLSSRRSNRPPSRARKPGGGRLVRRAG